MIRVDEIEEPRQLYTRSLARDFMEEVLSVAPPYEPRAGLELTAHLTKVGSGVLLEAETSVPLQSDCRRCLRTVATDLPVAFTLNMVTRPRASGHEAEEVIDLDELAASIDEGEADEEYFDGEQFDLAPLLREHILLELPPIEPLCHEACRGLCIQCGQVLDEGDCGHEQKPIDPRWAGLGNIKLGR